MSDGSQPEEDGGESPVIRDAGSNASLTGSELLGRVLLVDQSPIGRTPRSNPAVYTGAFDAIRELFAQSTAARQRGLKASAFSFNSVQGQCERCRGAGFEKIEMQFLSDVYVRCPDCQGRRYRPHILEVRLQVAPPSRIEDAGSPTRKARNRKTPAVSWGIADFLEATVEGVLEILTGFGETRPAKHARQALRLLQEVGLGYLRLGQPVTTLSGGESQRLKLAGYLAEFQRSNPATTKPSLFIFDEPTTGLHFDDVRVLLRVLQKLVDGGHSVLVVEHNLDVIKSADWILDLGPEAGDDGGQLVVCGTPDQVAACQASHTGNALSQWITDHH